MFAREERERKDCERVSVSEIVTLLFVSVSKEIEERASCTRVEEASDMQARKNDAIWGPLSPQKPKNGTVLGTTFPQMPNTTPFWEFLFPPKSPHDAVLGNNFPNKLPTLDRPSFFFLFFLVWFLSSFLILVWFKWINGFGLFFFAISDVNILNNWVIIWQWVWAFFFFFQSQILMYVLWVIIWQWIWAFFCSLRY